MLIAELDVRLALANAETSSMALERRQLSPEELPEDEKEKDRRTIKGIPEILGKVGLRVVRLA